MGRDNQAAQSKHDEAYLGKPLPTIVLHDSEGAAVPITRFRGHPLLIDFGHVVWITPGRASGIAEDMGVHQPNRLKNPCDR